MQLKAGCGQEGLSDELGSDGGRKVSRGCDTGVVPTVLHHPAGTYGENITQVRGEPKGTVISFIRAVFNTQGSRTPKLSHNS